MLARCLTYRIAPNVDEAARLARKHGGQVRVEPFDMPYGRTAVWWYLLIQVARFLP